MPQANPEKYLNDIAQRVETAAKTGKRYIVMYENADGIPDIAEAYRNSVADTVTHSIKKALTQNGYGVFLKPGDDNQRDPTPASMTISW